MRSRPDQVASWGPLWRSYLDDRLRFRGVTAKVAKRLVEFEGPLYDANRARQLADKLSAMRRSNGPHPEPESVFEVAVAFTLYSEDQLEHPPKRYQALPYGWLKPIVKEFVKRFDYDLDPEIRALSPLSYYYAAGQLDAYIDAFVYLRINHAYHDVELDEMYERVVQEIADGSGVSDVERFGREWGAVLPPESTREAVTHLDANKHISLAHAVAQHFELHRDVQFHGVTTHLRDWVNLNSKRRGSAQ